MNKSIRKIFIDPIEFLPLFLVYVVFKILPLRLSSYLGGLMARTICPLLPVHKIGEMNLKKAFPNWTSKRRAATLNRAWDNLGRVVGEFPHLKKIAQKYTEVVDLVGLDSLEKEQKSKVFFSAHMANWEIPHLILMDRGMKISLLSRPPNNWLTRLFFMKVRHDPSVSIILKGREGSKDFLKAMQGGHNMGILLDQRLSEGDQVPFFGRDALTPIVPGRMAYKFGALMIPVQVERTEGVHFRITYHKPLKLKKAPLDTARDINKLYENWIADRPDQWLWFHNRWKI